MNHGELRALHLEARRLGQRGAQLRLVDVAMDRVYRRAKLTQLLQGANRAEVARVNEEVGCDGHLDAGSRQPVDARAKMSIGEDCDPDHKPAALPR